MIEHASVCYARVHSGPVCESQLLYPPLYVATISAPPTDLHDPTHFLIVGIRSSHSEKEKFGTFNSFGNDGPWYLQQN